MINNKNMFQKATRKKAKLRLAITGVSGSGKTYSALTLAKGLGGKIACIDTESCSASLYSHLADFDVCELSSPFTPDRYIEAITQAEEAGYNVLIIDSMSAAWAGSGGVLEMVDDITKASKSKNSYMAWNQGSKEQEKLIQKILTSSLHVIACMRSKTAYELTDNGQGRKTPIKVGLQPIQRENTEYEFQVVFDISRDNHYAIASKDRTELFKDTPFLITEKTGKTLLKWLDEGIEQAKTMGSSEIIKQEPKFIPKEIEFRFDEIASIIKDCTPSNGKTINDLENLYKGYVDEVKGWNLPQVYSSFNQITKNTKSMHYENNGFI